jgi:hypothetical protein
MDRKEALAVLHQINDECKEAILMFCVSIDSLNSQLTKEGTRYLIKIKCDLDDYSRKCLNPILQRNGLSLKEENGFVIILKPG